MDTNSNIAVLEIESQISDDNDSESKYINELEYFMVNGEKLNLEEDSSTRDNPKKTLYKIDIVLDKFNNWTKKTYLSDNTITRIITREIEYYCH